MHAGLNGGVRKETMKPISVHEIRQAVGGRLLSSQPTGLPVLGVCTDTRRMEPSSLFIAIKGENFDGHGVLPQAAPRGAIAAMVQDVPAAAPPNVTLIQVNDTRGGVGNLGA